MTKVLVVGGCKVGPCHTTGQLEPRGYVLERVATAPPAAAMAGFDVVIFVLPAGAIEAALQACAQLRRHGPSTLVLSPGADPDEAAHMLEAGADDCLPAPHNPREVVARVRALLRRRALNLTRAARYEFAGCQLDPANLLVRAAGGRAVEITPLQHRLLSALAERAGEVVSREHLLAQVLGEDSDSFDRAIDVHVSRLKKRLAQVDAAELITAYRGVGYRLEAEETAP